LAVLSISINREHWTEWRRLC